VQTGKTHLYDSEQPVKICRSENMQHVFIEITQLQFLPGCFGSFPRQQQHPQRRAVKGNNARDINFQASHTMQKQLHITGFPEITESVYTEATSYVHHGCLVFY